MATDEPSRHSATDRWVAWDRFLEAKPETGFMQSSWWADFRSTVGFHNFGITLKNGNAIIGGATVQRYSHASEGCFYYVQDGPVLPIDESVAGKVFEAILASIDQRRKTEKQTVSHLRIEPRWQHLPSFVRGFRTLTFKDSFVEPRNTLCIDLRPSEEAILAQMKPKGRYNIRVAQKHGLTVVEDTSDKGLADFLSIYEDTATRQGMGAKPPRYFQTLVSSVSPAHRGSLFFSEYQGMRIAAALVVYFGSRATYFYGGSRGIHRHVMAPYLLHFEIMRKAKALGHAWYDLWGVAPGNEPDHPWANISAFKTKFGGVAVHLVPTLDYVYDAEAYDGYVATRRHSGAQGFRSPLPPEGTLSPERREQDTHHTKLFNDALPGPLFDPLVRAVRAVGTERMEGMGTYNTTFWFPLDAQPSNIVEECVSQLHRLVHPGPRCIGMEWWLGRLKYGEALRFHVDRDRSLNKQTGETVHPLWSSILYLNRFPSSPTVVLDQVLSPDGKSWVPPEPTWRQTLDAVPNHYAVFRGDLRHGVVANAAEHEAPGGAGQPEESPELRLTLLINYWDRRPMPPNCRDYDGAIYNVLHNHY